MRLTRRLSRELARKRHYLTWWLGYRIRKVLGIKKKPFDVPHDPYPPIKEQFIPKAWLVDTDWILERYGGKGLTLGEIFEQVKADEAGEVKRR